MHIHTSYRLYHKNEKRLTEKSSCVRIVECLGMHVHTTYQLYYKNEKRLTEKTYQQETVSFVRLFLVNICHIRYISSREALQMKKPRAI